jgi:membrane protease YdiL (CAAX protease family)
MVGKKKHLAVWLTAFLFSVVHLQYQAVLPRFLLGALIGYLYMNSSNLLTAILLHFFYNTSLVFLTFMIQHQTLDASWEYVGIENILIGVIAILFTIWIAFRSPSKII